MRPRCRGFSCFLREVERQSRGAHLAGSVYRNGITGSCSRNGGAGTYAGVGGACRGTLNAGTGSGTGTGTGGSGTGSRSAPDGTGSGANFPPPGRSGLNGSMTGSSGFGLYIGIGHAF